MYSMERQPVNLMGSSSPGSVGAFASKTTQILVLTAVTMGSAGNSITIAFTGGGTAGAEVVSVSNLAISVRIESGVSTVTQVRTALNASPAAAALVSTVGTNAATVVSAAALPLLGGADTAFTSVGMKGMTMSQIGTGIYKISIADPYAALLSAQIMLGRSSAVDLKAQIKSVNTLATGSNPQSIIFRIIAVATETNLASGDIMYIDIKLRNSSS